MTSETKIHELAEMLRRAREEGIELGRKESEGFIHNLKLMMNSYNEDRMKLEIQLSNQKKEIIEKIEKLKKKFINVNNVWYPCWYAERLINEWMEEEELIKQIEGKK